MTGRPHLLKAILLAPTLCLFADTAQAQLPQLSPGPDPTAFWDWNHGTTTTTHPTSGAPLNVNHYGRLYYPTNGGGGSTPPVKGNGTQKFPFVVFGHGRLQGSSTTGSNHLQAGYLMERLASWGVIATSVNLDVVGSFGFPAAIPQRGDIIIDTIVKHLNLGAQPGTPPSGLAASFDDTRIILLGHSRGGEGVVSAYLKNLSRPTPFSLLGVGNIAPTDFDSFTMPADAPYISLYGSKDGDVNNGWPIRLHDRALSEEKIFQYIYGANHFWFTETITFSPEGPADIPRSLHHDIAMGYLAGFAVRKFTMPGVSSEVFADGPEMNPVTSQTDILPMYRHPDRSVMDDFQTNTATNLSSSGTLVKLKKFLSTSEIFMGFGSSTLYHFTRGLEATWNGGNDAIWGVKTTGGPFNATQWDNLSIKFAIRQNNGLNPVNQDQDVSIGLMDADKDVATVRISDFGDIPYPPNHGSSRFPIKSVLRTTRVPLSAFTAANPNLDLTRIIFAGWTTDQTNTGALLVDDVEFTD